MFVHDHKGPYAMHGFGLDVPYSDAQGSTKTVTAGTGTLCGSSGNAIALQAMLADLGFYHGAIDGQMGSGTRSAVLAFAAAQSVDPGAYYPSGAICDAIMNAYQLKHAAPAPAAAAPVASRLFLNPAILAAFGPMASTRAGALAPGGGAAPVAAPSGGGVTGWWASQSTTMKIGLGVAVAAILGLGVYAATAKPKAATPNRAKPKPRTCRKKPPRGYPKKRSAYALPECFMYPLNNKARVRTAAARFGKHKRRYPPAARGKIARRIDSAKRRFHIGEYR